MELLSIYIFVSPTSLKTSNSRYRALFHFSIFIILAQHLLANVWWMSVSFASQIDHYAKKYSSTSFDDHSEMKTKNNKFEQ